MDTQVLEGGFTDPARQSARAFRAIMESTARPGTIHDIDGATPPAPLSVAAGAVILTLCDGTTPVYIAGDFDTPAVRDWITFHTGAPIVDAALCQFAIGAWQDLPALSQFSVGTSEYPDRSATIIVELDEITQTGATLVGPGIKDAAHLSIPDVAAAQTNAGLYPLGLDFIFTSGARVAALPRSTEVR